MYGQCTNHKNSVKDKNAKYWETFNNGQANQDVLIRCSSNTQYSISDEYSTMGKYSLKCSSSNWAWTYYRIPPSLLAQINVPFTFKCDVSTTGGDLMIVVWDDTEKQSTISLPSGDYPVEITYNNPTTNLTRVELGYRSTSPTETKICYIDNITVYF